LIAEKYNFKGEQRFVFTLFQQMKKAAWITRGLNFTVSRNRHYCRQLFNVFLRDMAIWGRGGVTENGQFVEIPTWSLVKLTDTYSYHFTLFTCLYCPPTFNGWQYTCFYLQPYNVNNKQIRTLFQDLKRQGHTHMLIFNKTTLFVRCATYCSYGRNMFKYLNVQ